MFQNNLENLSCVAARNGGGMVVLRGTVRPCQKFATNGSARYKWHGLATWRLRPVFMAWLCYMCSIRWDFHATLFHGFKLALLALLSAKYRLSFHFFDKVLENTERCCMSKMYASGG